MKEALSICTVLERSRRFHRRLAARRGHRLGVAADGGVRTLNSSNCTTRFRRGRYGTAVKAAARLARSFSAGDGRLRLTASAPLRSSDTAARSVPANIRSSASRAVEVAVHGVGMHPAHNVSSEQHSWPKRAEKIRSVAGASPAGRSQGCLDSVAACSVSGSSSAPHRECARKDTNQDNRHGFGAKAPDESANGR